MSAPFSHALSQPNPFGLERKMKKPLMEKRRRARINHCLLELKSLLLQAGPHQRTKLEKADILEMTVQHVKKMGSSPKAQDTSVVRQSYVDGYSGCAGAVLQYFNSQPQLADTPLRLGLVNHLNGFLADRMKSLPPPSVGPQKLHHQSRVSTSISVKIPQQTSTSVVSAFAPLQPTNQAHFQPSGSELPTPPYSLPDQGRSAFRRDSNAAGTFPVDFRRDSAADSPFSMDASSNGDTNSSLSPVSSDGGDLASPFPRGSPQKTAAVWRPW